ncbi:hypothetical protein [Staphylococcus simulans]|uniref:hypothetical protein n=1 Tax=Staphylococcus simulans TaxID=1286 RepID=UPI0030EDC872
MKKINRIDPFVIVEERLTGKHIVEVSGSNEAVADFYDLSIKTYTDSSKYKIYTNLQVTKKEGMLKWT